MKKLIILSLLLCISLGCFSQQLQWFTGLSADSAKLLSDNIVSLTKTQYKLHKVVPADKDGSYQLYQYIKPGTESKPETLTIAFQLYNDGGKSSYYLKKIPAIELADIFPFWNKYINPVDDLSTVSSQLHSEYLFKDKEGKRIKKALLDKEQDAWQLWIN